MYASESYPLASLTPAAAVVVVGGATAGRPHMLEANAVNTLSRVFSTSEYSE